jgi:DNA-directed RNA polymerase subunit K/omega
MYNMSLAISNEGTDVSKLQNPLQLKIDDDSDVSEDEPIVSAAEEDEVEDSASEAEEEPGADIDVDDDDVDDDAEDADAEDADAEDADADESKTTTQKKSTSLTDILQNVSKTSTVKQNTQHVPLEEDDDEDDEEEEEDDDEYLQKFDTNMRKDYILDFHPEQKNHDYNEVAKLSKVTRDKSGQITDPFHKTTPILTKYEKTKVLGQRAKQLDEGCKSFVKVNASTLDGYIIAMDELNQHKLPFIIRRPIPNGGVEYWPVKELEIIH